MSSAELTFNVGPPPPSHRLTCVLLIMLWRSSLVVPDAFDLLPLDAGGVAARSAARTRGAAGAPLESVWKFVTAPLPASSSRWAGGVRLCVGTWVAVAGWRRLVMDGRGYGHTAGTGVGHVSLGCTAGTPLHRAVLGCLVEGWRVVGVADFDEPDSSALVGWVPAGWTPSRRRRRAPRRRWLHRPLTWDG